MPTASRLTKRPIPRLPNLMRFPSHASSSEQHDERPARPRTLYRSCGRRGRRQQPLALEAGRTMHADLLDIRVAGDFEENFARGILHQTHHVEARAAFADHLRIDASCPNESAALGLDERSHVID